MSRGGGQIIEGGRPGNHDPGRLLWPPNWSDPYFGHFFHQIKKRGGQSGVQPKFIWWEKVGWPK
jgi:hypothetical protein